MWQVALVTSEVSRLGVLLMGSRASQIDRTGEQQLQVLKDAENAQVNAAALMRSTAPDRQEFFGNRLHQIKTQAKKSQESPRASFGNVVSARTIEKASGSRGNKATAAMVASLQPCVVLLPSPEKLPVISRKRKSDSMIVSSQPKARRVGAGGSRFPLGEARIYRNWSLRRCYGSDCAHSIQQGEWFVNLPVVNMVLSTGLLAYQNIGFCLVTDGKCMMNPNHHIATLMRTSGYRIPTSLPVHVRGKQRLEDGDLEMLAALLPEFSPPYVGD